MIVAKADSISTLRATAFFAATAIAISTLAGCSTGPSTGDAQALSFEGLEFPSNIDVDSAGNVFVTDWGHDRVVRLGDATNEQSEVPFRGLTDLASITVGSEGSVYVSEGEGTNSQGRILKMPAGGTSQEVLTTREHPGALAVSDSGVVYFYDFGSPVVYKFIPETKSTEIEVALVHTNFPGFDQYFNDIALGNDGKLVAITGLPDPRILRVLSSQMLEELPFLKGKERFPPRSISTNPAIWSSSTESSATTSSRCRTDRLNPLSSHSANSTSRPMSLSTIPATCTSQTGTIIEFSSCKQTTDLASAPALQNDDHGVTEKAGIDQLGRPACDDSVISG